MAVSSRRCAHFSSDRRQIIIGKPGHAQSIDLQKKTLGNIASQMLPQTPINENNSWEMDVNGEKENLEWLIN